MYENNTHTHIHTHTHTHTHTMFVSIHISHILHLIFINVPINGAINNYHI